MFSCKSQPDFKNLAYIYMDYHDPLLASQVPYQLSYTDRQFCLRFVPIHPTVVHIAKFNLTCIKGSIRLKQIFVLLSEKLF